MKKQLFCLAFLLIGFNSWPIEYHPQNSPEFHAPETFRVEGSSQSYQGRGSHYGSPVAITAIVVAVGAVYAIQRFYAVSSWCAHIPHNGLAALSNAFSNKDYKDLNEMFAPKKQS